LKDITSNFEVGDGDVTIHEQNTP